MSNEHPSLFEVKQSDIKQPLTTASPFHKLESLYCIQFQVAYALHPYSKVRDSILLDTKPKDKSRFHLRLRRSSPTASTATETNLNSRVNLITQPLQTYHHPRNVPNPRLEIPSLQSPVVSHHLTLRSRKRIRQLSLPRREKDTFWLRVMVSGHSQYLSRVWDEGAV